ncbi:MAG: hypothetical protein J7L38_01770 [Thermoproteales archaeon]|nr:hypothetical protein [Thermoproteales archaeon]
MPCGVMGAMLQAPQGLEEEIPDSDYVTVPQLSAYTTPSSVASRFSL